MLVKHWWIVAKARPSVCGNMNKAVCPNHPNIYYHFGFNKGVIEFSRHDSFDGADMVGQEVGNNTHEYPKTLKSKSIQRPIKVVV